MRRVALALGAAALAAALIHSLRRHRTDAEEVVRAYFDAWSDGDGEAITAAGHVTMWPTAAGGCVTQPVAQFNVVGSFHAED